MLKFTEYSDCKNVQKPIKGTPYSAGFDICNNEEVTILAGERMLVSTGITMSACPNAMYLRVAPRSGMSVRGFDVGAGVVDSDYRGHIKVLMINNSGKDKTFEQGTRIAQLLPTMLCSVDAMFNAELLCKSIVSDRGDSGFGSTGN